MSKRKGRGITGRPFQREDRVACAHTALRPLLVKDDGPGGTVRMIQAECLNCRAQLRDLST